MGAGSVLRFPKRNTGMPFSHWRSLPNPVDIRISCIRIHIGGHSLEGSLVSPWILMFLEVRILPGLQLHPDMYSSGALVTPVPSTFSSTNRKSTGGDESSISFTNVTLATASKLQRNFARKPAGVVSLMDSSESKLSSDSESSGSVVAVEMLACRKVDLTVGGRKDERRKARLASVYTYNIYIYIYRVFRSLPYR